MKPPKSKFSLLAWAFAAALYSGIAILTLRQPKPSATTHSVVTNLAADSRMKPTTTAIGSVPTPVAQTLQRSADASARRPFKPVRETKDFQWTAEDGTDTNVIRRLAHNDLEYQRMAEESGRIYRRQLVYANDTAAMAVQRAKASGAAIQQLTLPGLDGQEVPFEINATDLSPSGQQGSFSGRISGESDSMVTFAFKGGREAFTILSPKNGLYLVGEPREPGELIVKSINPDSYVVGVCGNPDK